MPRLLLDLLNQNLWGWDPDTSFFFFLSSLGNSDKQQSLRTSPVGGQTYFIQIQWEQFICKKGINSYIYFLFLIILLEFQTCFFSPPCKKHYCFHLVQGMKEGSRVVKQLLCGYRKGIQGEALMPEGLLRGLWALKSPGWAWGWAFERETHPARPGGPPAWGGRPWYEFHLLLQDRSPQEITEVEVCSREPGQTDPEGPSSGSSWQWRLHSVMGFTPLSWEASACPGRGRSRSTGFAFSKDSRPSWLLLGQLGKKEVGLAGAEPRYVVEMEAQKEVSARRCVLNRGWTVVSTTVE